MAARPDSPTHTCEWREKAEVLEGKLQATEGKLQSLESQLDSLKHQMETMTRRLLGPKSEKMPPVGEEAGEPKQVDWEAVQRKRRERQKQKESLETKTTVERDPAL